MADPMVEFNKKVIDHLVAMAATSVVSSQSVWGKSCWPEHR